MSNEAASQLKINFMTSIPPSPTSRVPYKHINTPPLTPARHLPQPTPVPLYLSPNIDEYPESPTNSQRRRSSSTFRPPPFGVNVAHRWGWSLPRIFRSPRRTLSCLLLLGFIILIYRSITKGPPATLRSRLKLAGWLEDDKECQFVSPVEAYHRDLARLRKIYPNVDFPRNTSHQHHHPQHHHLYSPTGHLLVSSSPYASHPIPPLLSLGEKRWEELLSRQSRTLSEAVKEYRRRYGRAPPKGFDIWWDFAQMTELVLPDEYDRINLDLAPFFALPRSEMKRRMRMVEDMPETFTLIVKDGKVDVDVCKSVSAKCR